MNGKTEGSGRESRISRRAILEQVPALVAQPALAALQGGVVAEWSDPSPGLPSAGAMPCAACTACTARFCRYKAVDQIPASGHAGKKEPS